MAREHGEPKSDAKSDGAAAFTLTAGELRALVAAAVRDALKAGGGEPLLLDRHALGRALGCSAVHVDAMRRKGLPVIMMGQLVRFNRAHVLTWLEQQSGGQRTPDEHDDEATKRKDQIPGQDMERSRDDRT